MARLNKRLEQLESRENPDRVTRIEIQLCSDPDHVHHPERYNWNTIDEQPGSVTTVFQKPTPKN